jgi:astacin
MRHRLRYVPLLLATVAALAPHARATPVLATGLWRGRPVTYAISGGQKIFEGDIVLDHVQPLPAAGSPAPPPPSVGVAYTQYLWPVGSQGVAEIPYIVTNAATGLSAALSAFNTIFAGVIQFVPYTSQIDYVNFDFDPNDLSGQCESSVGRIGGEQSVGGSASCTLGTVLHEMGHVVGLYHEMSRPDRNTYVTINTANIIKGSESNFNQLGDDFQDLTLFDYASVMEYTPYAFSRNGGDVVESIPPGIALSSLNGYSAGDIDGVKRLYGAAPAAVTVTSNPPGLSVIVDGAAVTTPQVFAWKRNSSHTLNVAAGAQSLAGSAYIYGRWNDNAAASHSVVVRAGNNTLAQPFTSPAVTVYSANFVQLSAYSASFNAAQGSVATSPAPQSYSGVSGTYFVARQPVTLTATGVNGYQFLDWSNISLPLGANPKADQVPDGGAPYAVAATFTNQPIFTITTVPAGLYFQTDQTYYYQGPQNFDQADYGWTPGSRHTVTGFSPNQPYSVNTRYEFNSWSDKGALSHTITVPAATATLTGTWTPQYVPIAYANPACAATITLTPSSTDGFYTKGKKVKITAVPSSGWILTGWSGDLAGRNATQTLTVNDEELAIATYNTTTAPLALTALGPAAFKAGSAGGTVMIKGNGFTSSTYAYVNNAYRAATFVSAHEITVPVTASDLTTAGAFPIGVANFTSSCSDYQALTFFVTR